MVLPRGRALTLHKGTLFQNFSLTRAKIHEAARHWLKDPNERELFENFEQQFTLIHNFGRSQRRPLEPPSHVTSSKRARLRLTTSSRTKNFFNASIDVIVDVQIFTQDQNKDTHEKTNPCHPSSDGRALSRGERNFADRDRFFFLSTLFTITKHPLFRISLQLRSQKPSTAFHFSVLLLLSTTISFLPPAPTSAQRSASQLWVSLVFVPTIGAECFEWC